MRPRAANGSANPEASAAHPAPGPLQASAADGGEGELERRAAVEVVAGPSPVAARVRGVPAFHDAFEGLRLLFTLAALVAVGYFGWQRLEPRTRLISQHSAAATPPAPGAAAPAARLETAVHSGIDPSTSLGRVLPYVDTSHGVAVGPEQGLLVIEYTGAAPAPRVRIDSRDIGAPPLAVPLALGRHELEVRRNRDSSFRYLVVRAGETRIITLPL